MAKTPTSELFSTLKSYLNQMTDGDRSPNEVASALNGWARESAESVKAKIAEEVEAQAIKMGFIKRSEYEKLVARVERLEKPNGAKRSTSSRKTAAAPKKAAKSSAPKKSTSAVKKVSKK
jgi:hypothetical protein